MYMLNITIDRYMVMNNIQSFADIRHAQIFQLILADCHGDTDICTHFVHLIAEKIKSLNHNGILADTDTQCFTKCKHTLGKIRKLLSQRFVSCAYN